MITATKKSVNAGNWKLEAYQMRVKLPKTYMPIYIMYYPDFDNEEERTHVRDYLNGKRFDEGIKTRISKIIKKIKVAA